MLTTERMAVARRPEHRLRHWRGMDPTVAAELTREVALRVGANLPMVWFRGGVAVPVVEWDLAALDARMRTTGAPVLSRQLLADRLAHDRDHVEPRVLRMLAFIVVSAFPGAGKTLGSAAGYCRAIGMIPTPPGADEWGRFEADFYGFTIVEANESHAQVVVQGRAEGKHPLGGVPHQRRLMEEQLFDVALRTGTTPPS